MTSATQTGERATGSTRTRLWRECWRGSECRDDGIGGGSCYTECSENGVANELTPKLTLGWPLQVKTVPINHECECECDQRGMGCHHDDEDECGQVFSCGQGVVGHDQLK